MCRYYWEEMLLAVEQVHRRRVVHLDIKPENFIQVGASSVSTSSYTSSSSTSLLLHPAFPPPSPSLLLQVQGVLKLIDFGLAKALPEGEDIIR